jgi:hypothetical protein
MAGIEFPTPVDLSYLISARLEGSISRTRPLLVDLDEDGKVDLQIAAETGASHKSVEYVQPATGNWLTGPVRLYGAASPFPPLYGTEFGPSAKGEVVDPGGMEPTVTNRWLRITDSLSQDLASVQHV